MNIQIFPHSFKKIGFIFSVIAFITYGYYNVSYFQIPLPGINTDQLVNSPSNGFIGLLNAFTGGIFANSSIYMSLLHLFSMVGIIIYIMSKEKVEDDYINKLRLESFHLTTVITIIIAIVLYMFTINPLLTLSNIIFPFIWCYIIVFFIKKRFHL